ncbi:hypothetical protein CBM2626_A50005 [Cupriavidus taiwanensis]|nr:hypothetical protein CBM2626_A50005 [Cupriavidus taiwanensis]
MAVLCLSLHPFRVCSKRAFRRTKGWISNTRQKGYWCGVARALCHTEHPVLRFLTDFVRNRQSAQSLVCVHIVG